MGNRVVVVFTDGSEYSPCVYLHWHASRLGDFLTAWRQRMVGREGDVQYGAARFVGICHEQIPGNLSLGIWTLREPPVNANALGIYDSGDAGVVVVNVKTCSIRRLSADLAECPLPDGWKIPAPPVEVRP